MYVEFYSNIYIYVYCIFSDIKFIIGPNRKTIYGHRCILSARCDVFRAMFIDSDKSKDASEVPFVLRDTTPDIFLPLLEYIYTNCVTLNQKIVSGKHLKFHLSL